MNRTSDRDTRIVALEEELRDVKDMHERLSARVDRIEELQAHMARALLKVVRELEARRER